MTEMSDLCYLRKPRLNLSLFAEFIFLKYNSGRMIYFRENSNMLIDLKDPPDLLVNEKFDSKQTTGQNGKSLLQK